ncbi:MAG: hypothetical protein HZA46_19465 [Planctomycetales bacterium]|nr:hypothetical protein [Planctomycetales bacterium]
MRRRLAFSGVMGMSFVYAWSVLALPGCQQASPPTPTAKTGGKAHADHDEHGHDEKGHDHAKEGGHGHHHAEHGPHKGTLVVLSGHKNHLELVLDGATGKLTGYVLDDDAHDAVAIKQTELELGISLPNPEAKKDDLPELIELKLVAVKPTDDGEASEFSGESDKLKGVKVFEAVLLSIKIGEKEEKEVKFNFPKGNEDHHH